jgi:hypothetical protein
MLNKEKSRSAGRSNEISTKTLNPYAKVWIKQLQILLTLEYKPKATARIYLKEMTLYFKY